MNFRHFFFFFLLAHPLKSNTYIKYSKEINDQDPKFKIDDIIRMHNVNNFLQKAVFRIDPKKFL